MNGLISVFRRLRYGTYNFMIWVHLIKIRRHYGLADLSYAVRFGYKASRLRGQDKPVHSSVYTTGAWLANVSGNVIFTNFNSNIVF